MCPNGILGCSSTEHEGSIAVSSSCAELPSARGARIQVHGEPAARHGAPLMRHGASGGNDGAAVSSGGALLERQGLDRV